MSVEDSEDEATEVSAGGWLVSGAARAAAGCVGRAPSACPLSCQPPNLTDRGHHHESSLPQDFRDSRRELVASTSYENNEDGEARAFAVAMAKVAWETKADDVVALHVAPLVYWTQVGGAPGRAAGMRGG